MLKWLNTRSWRLCFSVTALAALLLSVIAIAGTMHRKEEHAEWQQISNARIEAVSQRISALEITHGQRAYLVRMHEGGIGIFSGDGSVLYRLLQVDCNMLPRSDRKQLEEGILLHSEAALRALIEDYTS